MLFTINSTSEGEKDGFNQSGRILKDPVAPGKYNFNQIAYKVELVPTSAITIDWASTQGPAETKIIGNQRPDGTLNTKITEFFKFSQLRVTSKDGFQLEVDVRLIIRIPPPNAPFVIVRFGSLKPHRAGSSSTDRQFIPQRGRQKSCNGVRTQSYRTTDAGPGEGS